MQDKHPDDLLKISEAAKILHVHDGGVYAWVKNGTLRATRLGRIWRIRRGDVDAFIQKGMNTNEPDPE